MKSSDAHTACPACPEPVRALYAASADFVRLIDQGSPNAERIGRAYNELRRRTQAFARFVDAHGENQLHALSDELAAARHPKAGE